MKHYDTIIINTDGAARGNPGPAGVGAVITTGEGDLIDEAFEYIGEATNNVAEYQALIVGLKKAMAYRDKSVRVYLDSELLVKQLSGAYKVKNSGLKPLFTAAKDLLNLYPRIEIRHVPRERNKDADRLANEAIDRFEAGEIVKAVVVRTPGQGSLF